MLLKLRYLHRLGHCLLQSRDHCIGILWLGIRDLDCCQVCADLGLLQLPIPVA